MRIKDILVLVSMGAVLAGCGGGGGGGGSSTGGGGGSSATGGTGATAGTGGSGACAVNSTFQGQPGTLWVARAGDGQLTSYDTKDGKELATVAGPGSANGFTGGNGFLWLRNTNNDHKLTPVQPSGQASTPLDIDPMDDLVLASGKLWTFGVDTAGTPRVYAITSPTSVSEFPIDPTYTANADTASSEGHFFLGSKLPDLTSLLVVHVDAANSQIVWEVPVSSAIPSLGSATAPHLAALPGKLFVKFALTSGEQIFSIDTATQAIGPLVELEMNPGTGPMITDGTGLYVFDAGNQILYELDQDTFSAKRTLPLKGGDSDNTFIDNALAAAGGIWLGRNCGGTMYNRRVDIQAFTVADFEYKQAEGIAPTGYAYLSP